MTPSGGASPQWRGRSGGAAGGGRAERRGKSTLFRGLAGILKPLAGSIDLGGLDIRDIAYLPQSVDIDRTFPISVFDLVGTGLWHTTGFFGGMGKAARDKITPGARRRRPQRV